MEADHLTIFVKVDYRTALATFCVDIVNSSCLLDSQFVGVQVLSKVIRLGLAEAANRDLLVAFVVRAKGRKALPLNVFLNF